MAVQVLFPTLISRVRIGFDQALADECQALAASDVAGRRWSARHYPGGYTSYGSLDRLHLVSSVFAGLRRRIDPHVKALAGSLHYDLRGLRLDMTDCWLNVMPAGTAHSGHLHPTSFVSGTYYVDVPRGAAALKFEDPRHSRQMAAPPRRADAPQRFRSFVSVRAAAGDLILFESWLRHEVPVARFAGERVSISFNYGWEKKRR
jgi:uncharacterized protein (TIGR02466 family)